MRLIERLVFLSGEPAESGGASRVRGGRLGGAGGFYGIYELDCRVVNVRTGGLPIGVCMQGVHLGLVVAARPVSQAPGNPG